MLPQFGIINMNGRLYDPVLGRMLSPDNHIQMPDFTQNFNRYSYVLNNPLKYTDPTGEKWWHWVLGDILTGGLLTATATTTAAVGFSGYGSFVATMLPTVAATAYTVTPSLTATYDIFADLGDWSRTKNSFQIANVWFRADKDKNVFGQIEQVTARFAPRDHLATLSGNTLANYHNIKGDVESVEGFHGATVVNLYEDKIESLAYTVGPYIVGDIDNVGIYYDEDNHLTRQSSLLIHEYGHYLQGRMGHDSIYYWRY